MKSRQTELKRVRQAFFDQPLTMKEADKLTGIMRESICRYCALLRKHGHLFAIGKKRCSITGYPNVTVWTSNPDHSPNSNQLELF